MIKDILLRLDGTAGDFARLAAVRRIAAGLLFNVLPAAISDFVQDAGSSGPAKLPRDARKAGDAVDTASLVPPIPSWRFALNGQPNEPRGLIEELLYGAGRHLFLVPEDEKTMAPLDHVVVARNGSRESARSLSESLSYLQRARKVWLLVVEYERPAQTDGRGATMPRSICGITASTR
ncbi:hypothetical protein [Bradyrhizobium australafricanum]|uniref:hypothetical protein n=1 Tax=Bradyrhizobium australafricanum TaxID=2821406 RepID=UPI001CE24C57|nr:hypothetical protein [Bradyrhizobium australafricanum]MCA6100653.1 hypothetical protein [Bradyrhizobium australafricanum]